MTQPVRCFSLTLLLLAALGTADAGHRYNVTDLGTFGGTTSDGLALNAVGLYAVSAFSFAMLESYLHWRAGLGFHGLSCLVGPVHRNALPLLAALALVAAALFEAGLHLLGWMRAVARELLRPRLVLLAVPPLAGIPLVSLNRSRVPVRTRSRGPPLPV